jgi:SAM-dependent methyltransferase
VPGVSESLTAFLDDLLRKVFAERPAGIDPWFFRYFAEQAARGGARRYARALTADLALARVEVSGRTVLDAGSGFGLTLLCLARLGARPALGAETFLPMARSAEILRRRCAPGAPAFTFRASVHELSLPDRSVDFVYCNEALSHFLHPSAFLAEAARVLRPGGRLMICDGNNALNPRTVRRVHEIWRRFEEGPPSDDLHGHRIEVPYRARREAMIAGRWPEMDAGTRMRLAWGTFGRHGGEILAEAEALLAGGRLPAAPPAVSVSPVDPDKGYLIENLIHARALARELAGLGFTVRVHAHFGGARGAWIAAANRVLRSLGPGALPFARSVKVVAERR